MRDLIGSGVQVLCPLQIAPISSLDLFGAGEEASPGLPPGAFLRACYEALGTSEVTPALPLKKKAMDLLTAGAFFAQVRPERVHFLGLGPLSDRFPDLRRALFRSCPGAELSCDSVLITAQVGQGRPLTACLKDVTEDVQDEVFFAPGDLDYTDSIGRPEDWLTRAQIKALAVQASVSEDEIRAPDLCNPWLSHVLDQAWHAFAMSTGTGEYRKRQSVKDLCQRWRITSGRRT